MSIGCIGSSCVTAHAGKAARWLAVALGAASLAACAQSSVVSQKSELRAARQASIEHDGTGSSVTHRRVAAVKRHTPFARNAGQTKTQGLASFSHVSDEPLSWPVFEQAMAVLAALRGSDLLRVKGLVAVAECREPVVVHFVQHVAHPPIELEDWPDEDRRSRLVFITRGLARAAVTELFAGVAAVAASETAQRG